MTLVQITAILGLLLSFGVPQAKVDEVGIILSHSQSLVSSPAVKESVTIKSMKPAYTYDQLLHLFNDIDTATMRSPQAFVDYRYVPVSVTNISNTSAILSLNGGGYAWKAGEIWMNGTKLDIHASNYSEEITGLTPDTKYTYSFKWKEDGREDTVIEGTFKTAR